jgi:MoxR-like ATPase
MRFGSVDNVERALEESSYLPDRGLATSIFLALEMRRPLLLEGEAGVGKTEVGKTLASLLGAELDRADDEFEAFLLEVLSDYAVTLPELGTIAADEPPAVVITSNRTRELHDALKRRCLYHWIDFPDLEREVEIIRLRVPGVSEQLARSVAATVAKLRGLELVKRPGIAEAIDWAQALDVLGAGSADGDEARKTLGWAVKNHEDLARAEAALGD